MNRVLQAFQFYRNKGYTPAQAVGIVSNLVHESGRGLDTGAIGDKGTAFGVAQWRGPRRAGLLNFAADRGASPHDFLTQLAYVDHELNTRERGAGERLRRSQDVNSAVTAMLGYERPAGYQQGPYGSQAPRYHTGRQLLAQILGASPQQAAPAPLAFAPGQQPGPRPFVQPQPSPLPEPGGPQMAPPLPPAQDIPPRAEPAGPDPAPDPQALARAIWNNGPETGSEALDFSLQEAAVRNGYAPWAPQLGGKPPAENNSMLAKILSGLKFG